MNEHKSIGNLSPKYLHVKFVFTCQMEGFIPGE